MGNQCSACSLTEDELNEVKVEPKFEGEEKGATEAKTKTKTTKEKKKKEVATVGRPQNPAAANLLDAHPSGKAADVKDARKSGEEEAPPPAASFPEPGPCSRKPPPRQSGDQEVPHGGEPEVSGAAPASSAGAAFGELHTSSAALATRLSDEAPPALCASAPPAPCASAPPPAPAEADPPTSAALDEEVEVEGTKTGLVDLSMEVVDLPKNLGPMLANEESAVEVFDERMPVVVDLMCPDGAAKAFGAMEGIASPVAKPSATLAGCTTGPWSRKPSVGSWLMIRTSPQVSPLELGRCEEEASTSISKDVLPALDANELDVVDILPTACKADEDQESFVATSLEVNDVLPPPACKVDEDQESFVAAPLEADFDPLSEINFSPTELDSAKKVAPEVAATEVALEPELDSILEAKLYDQSVSLSVSDAPNKQDSDALKDLAFLEEEFGVVKDAHAGM